MFKIHWVRDPNNIVLKKPNLRNKEMNESEKSILDVLREEKLNKSSSRSFIKSIHSPNRNTNMDLVPLSNNLKNGSDNIFYERNEDRILAIRNQMDQHSNSRAIVFNEFNRIKTDYELKNELIKKIDPDSVLKQWEFKAKGKYQSKFLLAFKTNLFILRDEFISWIEDHDNAQIAYEQVPLFFKKVAEICDF